MEEQIAALNAAHKEILYHLAEQKLNFVRDMQDNPGNYEGFTKDDAIVWFIESF